MIKKFKNKLISIILIICTISSISTSTETESTERVHSARIKTLKFAQVLFRHGDRSPLDENRIPSDIHSKASFWKDGWGQLTLKGKIRMYHLGIFLRFRYGGYVEKLYSQNEAFIRSSDYDRTIASAKEVLEAFFPQKVTSGDNIDLGPIIVHSISREVDYIIGFRADTCPRYMKLLHEYLNTSEEIIQINKENEALYKYLETHSNREVRSIFDVGDIYDTLFVERDNNMTLPDWTAGVFPYKMKGLGEKTLTVISGTPDMQRLRGGPLLAEIIRNMEYAKLKDQGRPVEDYDRNILPKSKIYFYSGHDTTLSAFLMTLGVFDGENPPYGSSVFVELHKPEDNGGILGGLKSSRESEYEIKFFYRKDDSIPPLELKIPGCDTPCSILKLKQAVAPILTDDLKSECFDLSEKKYVEGSTMGVYLLSVLFSIGFLLLSLLGFFFITRYNTSSRNNDTNRKCKSSICSMFFWKSRHKMKSSADQPALDSMNVLKKDKSDYSSC